METKKISEMLFKYGKEKIKVLGTAEKTTCQSGPAGRCKSPARPASAKGTAKYSGAAKVLDYLFIDKIVNGLESDPDREMSVYSEYLDDGKEIGVLFDEKGEATYSVGEDSIISGYKMLIPIVLYVLSSGYDAPETKSSFEKIKESFIASGSVNPDDVLLFCDNFYYEAVINGHLDNYTIYPNDLVLDTMKQAYESEAMDEMPVLSDIEGKPMLKALDGAKLRQPTTETSKGSMSSGIEACLNGDYIIPFEWSEDAKNHIPSMDVFDDFVPSDTFYSVLKKIKFRTTKVLERMDMLKGDETLDDTQKRIAAIAKDYINTFLVGKPGTGKTTTLYAIGAALQMPVYTITLSKNTEEDTFQGMTKIIEGKLTFVPTEFVKCYEEGGLAILEEVNLPDAAVIMGALGQAVEAPFVLEKNGYETVRRHPLTIIFSTMNVGTNGSRGVSQAFSSRFKQTYLLDDPKEEDFINILSNYGDKKRAKWVYDAYQKILTYLKSPEVNAEDICLNITLRGCIGALENMEEGDSPKEAIENALVGKIAEIDLELANDVKENVVKGLRDLK